MTPDLITRYTQGDCYILAGEISRLTGWPVVASVTYAHVLVKHPSGMLLDISGLHPPGEFGDCISYPVCDVSWWAVFPDTAERVHDDAVLLLESLNDSSVTHQP